MVKHPLEFIDVQNRRNIFFVFLGITIAIFLVFQFIDKPLQTQASPSGIVSFELAGTPAASRAMLDSWNPASRLYNAFGLGFDFLFMPVYAVTISLAVLLSSKRRNSAWESAGNLIGWAAFAAPVFDAFENIALFSILLEKSTLPYPQIAYICALIKFCLIILAVLYGFYGLFFPIKK